MTRTVTVALVNPNTSVATTEMMVAITRVLLPPGMAVFGTQAAAGAAMIVDEAALAVAEAEVMRLGAALAGQADAVIVAAFADPGAARLRAHLSVPVIGIGEAAMREAAVSGRRFGVATTTPGLVRAIEAAVRRFGLDAAFTGVRLTGGDAAALAADPAALEGALARSAAECIGLDGAESVVIGGGPLSAAAAGLRTRRGLPVVEPVQAAARAVLARLGERPRASLSRRGRERE